MPDAEAGSPLSVDLLTTHLIAGVARCLREFSATALEHPYKLDSFMTVTRTIAHRPPAATGFPSTTDDKIVTFVPPP